MGGELSIKGVLAGLADRLSKGARRSRHSIDRGLRRVLDESANPACCSIEKVEHIRRLVDPSRSDSAPKVSE
jgi:hypothetical protein